MLHALPTQSETGNKSQAAIIAAVEELEQRGPVYSQELRIGVLRNYTVETILPFLKYHCYASGLQPVITVGDYDNVRQEIRNPASHIYTGKPDIIVVSRMLEHLDPNCARSDWDASRTHEAVFAPLEELLQQTSALIVVNTFVPPLQVENGLGAGTQVDHRVSRIQALNASVREFSRAHSGQVFVADWERILQSIGEDQAFDYRFWYMYRAPFKKDFVVRYAQEIVKIGRALKGKTKKCLILDCDNTLWGGVVGEDGVRGIGLDRNEYPGKCYHEFQQSVVNLVDQGVVVALCSKNNEEDVWEVFDNHQQCLLKRSHIAAWRINWKNKADNIASLAEELNLGLDSFVFVDDSDVECQLVRELLPDVTVLQVPQKVYNLPRLLFRDGLFDTLGVTAEDTRRTAMYVAEKRRDGLKRDVPSLGEYLASLQLYATIHAVDEKELTRVAQLVHCGINGN